MTAITALSSVVVAASLAVEVHDRQRQQADRQTQKAATQGAAARATQRFQLMGAISKLKGRKFRGCDRRGRIFACISLSHSTFTT